ncbi:hypothetical protein SLS62_005335 [Diatrype stigma]|uniref:Uncharacterized protein n=1 Tax=Diatrype stigma TaxID=117547 RepID=A0AAN9V3F1_9PEZI
MIHDCKAWVDDERCKDLSCSGWDGYCQRHSNQRQLLYDFYKNCERGAEKLRSAADPVDRNEHDIRSKHLWLTAAIAARSLHMEMFFHGDNCAKHEYHVKGLRWDLWEYEQEIYDSGLAIIVESGFESNVYNDTKDMLRDAVTELTAECEYRILWLIDGTYA